MNIDLEIFQPPTNCKKDTYFKTLNSKYLNLLLKSVAFKRDMIRVMSAGFLENYEREMRNKLLSIVSSWERKFTVENELREIDVLC